MLSFKPAVGIYTVVFNVIIITFLYSSYFTRKESNLMDSMVEKIEKYTENLEHVVASRTAQLLEEKKKTDALLYRMLPQ